MAHALFVLVNLGLCLSLLACGSAHPVEDQSSPSERIVGGYETHIADYPHQISMRLKDFTAPQNAFSHICGGSIIKADVIATSAYCIIGTVPSQYKIVAGTSRRNGNDGTIVSVSDIIMHEKYDPRSNDNDIALLILSPPLPLNNLTIKAIELASEEPEEGAMATITGWGTTSEGGRPSDQLLAVQAPIVSNKVCNKDYGYDMITPSMLCAGHRKVGGKDACNGDTGGPLIVDNKLHGIVSWGYGCGRAEYPGVNAKVSYLRAWIKSKVELP